MTNLYLRSVRASIQDYHPDFRITACSWPSFLYEDGDYDPQNPTKGLLKGKLLVKVGLICVAEAY
jgi:hypothetical protein